MSDLEEQQELMRIRNLIRPVDPRRKGIRRVSCVECCRSVGVKLSGLIWPHVDDFTGERCKGSGQRADLHDERQQQIEYWKLRESYRSKR
jgi:hypothetical protein